MIFLYYFIDEAIEPQKTTHQVKGMAKIKTQAYMTPKLVPFQLHVSFEGIRH